MASFRTIWSHFINFILWYSGYVAVWSKVNTSPDFIKRHAPKKIQNIKNEKISPPTFVLWIFGLYTAIFGIASGRYESRLDTIENLTTATITQLANDKARPHSFFMIGQTQRMSIYPKPDYLKLWNTISSMFARIGEKQLFYDYKISKWKSFYSPGRVSDEKPCSEWAKEDYVCFSCVDWKKVYEENNLEFANIDILKDIVLAYKDSTLESYNTTRDVIVSGYGLAHEGKYGDLYVGGKGKTWLNNNSTGYLVQKNAKDTWYIGGLIDAELTGTHFEGSNFSNSHLEMTNFENAFLYAASFSGAFLAETNFLNAKLFATDFSHSHIRGAFFFGADLRETSFQSADVIGAHFEESNLEGADFRYSDLKDSSFIGAKIDEETNFKMVRNIETACFDPGVKQEIIKGFDLYINEETLENGEKHCKEKRLK